MLYINRLNSGFLEMSANTAFLFNPSQCLRVVLSLALLFAAWHVTQHDIAFAGQTDAHEECQVCRLTQTPTSANTVSPALMPLYVLLQLSAVAIVLSSVKTPVQQHRARAPPAH